eukprot:scaffold328590_cov55-Tisochrysis_lutea.AAC.1
MPNGLTPKARRGARGGTITFSSLVSSLDLCYGLSMVIGTLAPRIVRPHIKNGSTPELRTLAPCPPPSLRR